MRNDTDKAATMFATARCDGRGLRNEVDVNGRHMLLTDEPERLGGTDEAPAPHELLPAMLAACAETMIAMYAQKRGWDIGETSVEVRYDPDSVPRHVSRSSCGSPPGSPRSSDAGSNGSPRRARCGARWKPASRSRS